MGRPYLPKNHYLALGGIALQSRVQRTSLLPTADIIALPGQGLDAIVRHMRERTAELRIDGAYYGDQAKALRELFKSYTSAPFLLVEDEDGDDLVSGGFVDISGVSLDTGAQPALVLNAVCPVSGPVYIGEGFNAINAVLSGQSAASALLDTAIIEITEATNAGAAGFQFIATDATAGTFTGRATYDEPGIYIVSLPRLSSTNMERPATTGNWATLSLLATGFSGQIEARWAACHRTGAE